MEKWTKPELTELDVRLTANLGGETGDDTYLPDEVETDLESRGYLFGPDPNPQT